MSKKLFIRLGIFLFVFYLTAFVISQIFNITLEQIQEIVLSFGALAPVVYAVVLFLGLTVPFNPVSDFLIINLGVLLFPLYISIPFTFIAHSLVLVVNYYVGLRFGKRILEKVVTAENSQYMDKYFNKLTIKNLFIIRFFVPITSIFGADIVSYIAGMQKLPFFKYYVVSIVPWTILSVLYFTTTAYFIDKSIFLYFLPVIILVGLPILLFYIYNIKFKKW